VRNVARAISSAVALMREGRLISPDEKLALPRQK